MSPQGTPRLHPLDSGDDDNDSDLGMALIRSRAGKSKSLIRWKRLKGGKRRKKAEKANLIYD